MERIKLDQDQAHQRLTEHPLPVEGAVLEAATCIISFHAPPNEYTQKESPC